MSWAIDERERGWPAIVVVGGRSRWLVGLPDVLFAQDGRLQESILVPPAPMRCARSRTRVCRPDPRFRARRVRCCRAALAGQQASTCTVMLSVCRKDPMTELGDGERHTVVVPVGRKPAPAARLVSIRDDPSLLRGWLVWLPWDRLRGRGPPVPAADAAALHMHESKNQRFPLTSG